MSFVLYMYLEALVMSLSFEMQLDTYVTVYCVYVQCGRSFTSQLNDAYCHTSRTWPVLCVMEVLVEIRTLLAFDLLLLTWHCKSGYGVRLQGV